MEVRFIYDFGIVGGMANRLLNEKSPYLLQHANNPVDWYPWGEEAFRRAQAEQRPIFLSIGYSTCYWCHVMESNSFEDAGVAALLNDYFVPIKVDREERPDIDEVYMDAVIGLSGHGGWPMSVFLTPDRKPFFGATFFWREAFADLLRKIQAAWSDRRSEIFASAQEITQFLRREADTQVYGKRSHVLSDAAFEGLLGRFDPQLGGFGGAPKFPPAVQLSFLLRHHRRTGRQEALQMVTTTIDGMLRGGIYDQLGGGFARYSTDERWLVPHFEKMLYDNALIAVALLEAYQVTGFDRYETAARETLSYLLREMRSPEGAFASAEDAGEVGKEGEFYVWDESSIQVALGVARARRAIELFGVLPDGNFEHGKSVLHRPKSVPWDVYADAEVVALRADLLTARGERVRPLRDDKVLVGWNGLAIQALAKGFLVLRDESLLRAAECCADFIQRVLHKSNPLQRRFRAGEARGDACLDDYALLIEGLLTLYECRFDSKWVTWAMSLADEQHERLWDRARGGYYTSGAEELPLRKREAVDGALPSGNSVTLQNLIRLQAYTGREALHDRSEQLWLFLQPPLVSHPQALCKALHALDLEGAGPVQLAVVGGDPAERTNVLREFQRCFLPHVIFKGEGQPGQGPSLSAPPAASGRVTFYLCRGSRCEAPTSDHTALLRSLHSIPSATM